MKKINYSILLTLVFASVVLSSYTLGDKDKWIKFKDEHGAFEIKLPGMPEESSQTEDTEVGPIEIHMFMYLASSTEIYVIGYNDMPEELMAQVDEQTQEDMLNGGFNGGLGALEPYGKQETVIDEQTHFKFKGKWKALRGKAHNGTYYVRILCLIKENRLYQVWHLGDGKYGDEKDSDKFFKSFKLK